VEIVSLRGLLEHFAYQGRDGARQFLRDSAETWSEAELELLEFDVRGMEMLVDGRMRAIGRASGAVAERPLVWAVRVRDGRVARVAAHETTESARRELGWAD
jgi:ketosteroid isomerase-like protein